MKNDNDNALPPGGKVLDFTKPKSVDTTPPPQKNYTISFNDTSFPEKTVIGYLFVTADLIAVGNGTGEPSFMTYPHVVHHITAEDVAQAAA